MATWQPILSFVVSMFMFGLGYSVARRRSRVVPGLLCRVVDGPEEGRLIGLAEDGTVLMELRGPPETEPPDDDAVIPALRATNDNLTRAVAVLRGRRVSAEEDAA